MTAVEIGHLIGADNERLRSKRGDSACLRLGETQCRLARAFVYQRRFVDVGGRDIERQSQPLEERAAVGRRRGKHERAPSRWTASSRSNASVVWRRWR